MSEKTFPSRFVCKHDTEENWKKATNFSPKQAEPIIYDIDENYSYERLKIGDGTTNVNDLPFADEAAVAAITAHTEDAAIHHSHDNKAALDLINGEKTTSWDGAVSHMSDEVKHITSTERSNWDSAKEHADSNHAPSDAEANQNAFSNVVVGSTTIAADSKTDTLTLVAGDNVTITPDATNDKITISSTAKKLKNYYSSRPTNIDLTAIGDGSMFQFKCTGSVTSASDPGDGHILQFNWDNANGYDTQVFVGLDGSIKNRTMAANTTTWKDWTVMAPRPTRYTGSTASAVSATDNSYRIYSNLTQALTVTCTTDNYYGSLIRITFASGGSITFKSASKISGDDYSAAAVGETWEFSILSGVVICKNLSA